MRERDAFEAWATTQGAKPECFQRNALDEYVYYKETGLAWKAWLASRVLAARALPPPAAPPSAAREAKLVEAAKVLTARGDWPLHTTTKLDDDDEEIGGDICVICGAFDSEGLVEGHPHHDNCEWMEMVKAVRALLSPRDVETGGE